MATKTSAARSISVKALPVWPALIPFGLYALWWLLGIGDFVWILAAAAMAISWLGRRNLRLPWQMVLWLIFLAWVVVSLGMNDTAGRLVGSVYRLLLYGSAGVFAVHVYNARALISVERVSKAMVWFLAGMSACGYVALAWPQLVIKTPMAWVMPAVLRSNSLISDMVIRRTSQWNPNAWVEQAIRPAAPFLYANTWGNVYSLVLPFACVYLWFVWRTSARWIVLAVILASVPPALSTLNRGMFIGLAVVAAWVAIQALRRGAVAPVVGGVAVFAACATGWFFSPLGREFVRRIQVTQSTVDRGNLYRDTFNLTLQSPLIGFGSPRPAEAPWLPSLGTQGQLWTVLYSHGFVGAALFMGFLAVVFLKVAHRSDPVGAVLAGLLAATIVEASFYGMMTGIMVTMVAAGLALRPEASTSSEDRPGTGDRRTSTTRSRS